MRRRTFLATGAAAATPASDNVIRVDPTPRFALSPFLYMQFMEPLGATDSSVEAAWNHKTEDWREDVVAVTRELGPTMVRWGGIFCDYYRWREGVGRRADRRPMYNLLWGGIESNQVGTAEFVDFVRRVGADPLICVNFESDGRPQYRQIHGVVRTADSTEATEWVAYCNRADNAERHSHGYDAPLRVPYWQLGNETSYAANGFNLETAKRKTVEFARAMRRVDPSIHLIGWGGDDHGSRRRNEPQRNWTQGMAEAAGEYLDLIAFHHMWNPDDREHPVLGWGRFRKDPAATWDLLMGAWKAHDEKIRAVRDRLGEAKIPLALTECHYTVAGRNRCEVLSTWAAGVSYARVLNVHERHGDVLKIATAADFCGTRWQNNAVMIPVPGGRSFLMPVAHVMKLYRHHTGEQAVRVRGGPDGLDVTASRTGDRLFLHVVNTNRGRGVSARFDIAGHAVGLGQVFVISADPMVEIRQNNPKVLEPREQAVGSGDAFDFPAASVSAVELELAARA